MAPTLCWAQFASPVHHWVRCRPDRARRGQPETLPITADPNIDIPIVPHHVITRRVLPERVWNQVSEELRTRRLGSSGSSK